MKLKLISRPSQLSHERAGERGVALLTMLLLATLLLSAGGALVLTTMMAATTAIDSTAEMQAYYGAEVGLQQAMNALRGHVYKSADTPKIDLRSVVEPDVSNVDDDPATDSNVARMSQWLPYTDTDEYPSRIAVGSADNNGTSIAYSITARDVDPDSKIVTYSTSGLFEVGDSDCEVKNSGLSLYCANGVNSITITYVPQPSTTVTAYPAIASDMGSFTVAMTGVGYDIDKDEAAVFRLTVNQTGPWASRDTFIASVWGEIKLVGASNARVDFTGSTVKASGTQYVLCGGCNPLHLNHPVLESTTTELSATITAPQPKRILIQSTGYGPKGAIKKLEMVVRRGVFDLDAPAPLTIQGASDGTAPTFNTGSSGSKEYSGKDQYGTEGQLPTVAITGTDISTVNTGIPKPETIASPMISVLDNSTVPTGNTIPNVSALTPDFLKTADVARELLDDLQASAESMDRYYKPAADAKHIVTSGNSGASKMTFVDGNCEIEGGSGLVIVTGKLTMNGNPNFSGVVLVLGEGDVLRDGGGSGIFQGAMLVAKFDRHGTGDFLAPSFFTKGGGDSKFFYNSFSVTQAMASLSAVPGGVREY